jgi:uncharacterized protein YggT (Ycf19 family)
VRDRIEFDDAARSERAERRSRALFEIGLWLYAILSGLIVARIVILAFNVQGNVWIVEFIDRLTHNFVWPLQALPAGSTRIAGNLTLTDVTLITVVVLVPLLLMAFGRPNRHRRSL